MLPSIILGVLTIVTAAVVFLLPETLGQVLPDTIAQVEQSSVNKKPRYVLNYESFFSEFFLFIGSLIYLNIVGTLEAFQPQHRVQLQTRYVICFNIDVVETRKNLRYQ